MDDNSIDDDDLLSGCDLDLSEESTTNEEVTYLPLFAEALDPNSNVTIEDVAEAWGEPDALPTTD